MSRLIATIPAALVAKDSRIVEAFKSKPDRYVLQCSRRTGNVLVFDAETYVPPEERADGKSHSSEQTSECTGSLHMSVEPARKIYRDPSPEASPIVRRFADYRNPRHRERAAATICSRGTAARALEYFCSVRISEEHWKIGRAIGEARTAIAIHNGRAASRAREWDNETSAAVAEFVVSKLLGEGLAQRIPLVLDEADAGVDLTFTDGTRADVKAVEASHDAVFINNSTHLDKSPDFYVVAHIFSEIIDLFVVSAAAVDRWKVCKHRNGKPLPTTEWYKMGPLFPPKPAMCVEKKRDTSREIAEALAILAS